MKKIIIALLTGIILLSLASCADEETDQSYSIKDALKISAWVVDKELWGNGYWLEDEKSVKHGWWVDESTEEMLDSDNYDIFVYECLNLNEVRTLAPSGWGHIKLGIFFEFDGMIEVTTEDEHILLVCDRGSKPPYGHGSGKVANLVYGDIKIPYEACVSIWPMDKYILKSPVELGPHTTGMKIGREHYLNVNAYKFDNEKTPVISAKLKLIVLEDTSLSSTSRASMGEDYSRFWSIELVSYEYSDMAKLLDDIVDDEIE